MQKSSVWAFVMPVLILVALAARIAHAGDDADPVSRGRYLVQISGCNDCHTAGYAQSGGNLEESQWLMGDRMGFNGPWGTTYPTNLRLRIGAMDLPAWKAFARKLVARPPMPYWALNAMTDADLAALWSYVHALGPAGQAAPVALAPGIEPTGPVWRVPAPPPEASGK